MDKTLKKRLRGLEYAAASRRQALLEHGTRESRGIHVRKVLKSDAASAGT